MSASVPVPRGSRPQLKLVASNLAPLRRHPIVEDWRRVAAAVLACTQDIARHLTGQHWSRVDETLRERRELLDMLAEMRLDAEGRRCLASLEQATLESERAVLGMMGAAREPR